MNKTESLRNWLVILALLIVTGIATAVWPLLDLGISIGFGPTRPPVEQPTVSFPVPALLTAQLGTEIVLNSTDLFLAFIGMLVFTLVSIVVVGFILSFLVRQLEKSATAVANSDTYQNHVATLNKRQQEKMKAVRESHAAPHTPKEYIYHLDPISLSLIVLFFVALLGTLIYSELAPTGQFMLFGQTFTSSLPILIILFAITIPLLIWRARREHLLAIPAKDSAAIPWDFIAVLVTGLLIVGVGLGFMLFINNVG
ncbi:MAG: hypothetical protein KA773_14295 [Chloroflexi bacterium]|nr:hypothetical protein [Chloroflexota bacterium]